ncbi:MAG: PQQ-binding-like beta-propeller repeat protein, partial [Phycisphaerae bacterium]
TFAQLIVHRGAGYVGTLSGKVIRVDLATGKAVWQAPVGGPVLGSVAAAGERVFAADYGGKLTAMDTKTGKVLWTYDGGAPSVAHVLAIDGKVIHTDLKGRCHAVAAETGKALWTFDAGTMILHSPASDGRRVFFGSEAMRLYALDLAGGKKLWEAQLLGMSLKEGWPVVSTKSGTVMVSVMPLPNRAIQPVRDLQIHRLPRPRDPAEHEAMQEKILAAIRKTKGAQVHWFLDSETGREKFVAPMLYNCGRWATMAPACVDPNGDFVGMFMYPPSRPMDRWQYLCTHQGTFSAETGRLIGPYFTMGHAGWDEYAAHTLAGRTIFHNHWGMVWVQDMDSPAARGRGGSWQIDMPGHYLVNERTRREGGYPGWGGAMQNGSNGVSIAGGRVYCISSSHIACAAGRLKGGMR